MDKKRGWWRLGAVWLLAVGTAGAQPVARSYAVISEMAREVSVVSFQESTGSRLGNNNRQLIAVPDGALDKVALLSTQQALKSAAAGAPAWLLAPADTDFFDWQRIPTEKGTLRLPDDLAAALKQNGSTHLLLYTRIRAPAQLRFKGVTHVEGNLDGLGFFIDRQTQVVNLDRSAAGGVGFLAPYAYFRLTLVDTSNGQVLKTETALASDLYSPGEGKDGSVNPWEALTATEKMNKLRDMLRLEVARLVPRVLAAP